MKKRITFKKLLFEQQILGILLFTLLVAFLWIISSIYFSYSASTLTTEDTNDVLALDPTIDEKPLVILNSRKWWTPEELTNFSVSATIDDGLGNRKVTIITGPTVATSSAAPSSPTPVASASATFP